MKIRNLILALAIAGTSLAHAEEVKIMHLQMGGNYHQIFMQEIMSQPSAEGESVKATLIPSPTARGQNPFHLTNYNFDFGDVFFKDGMSSLSQVPIAPKPELDWFRTARESGQMADLMIISGHHIPGLGWHSNTIWGEGEFYTKSLMLATLLRTREENPDARAFFNNVKFVFISGCWGLANLEPHGDKGELLSQNDLIRLYMSGPEGRNQVHGTAKDFYLIDSERQALAANYPGDFTNDPNEETCIGTKCSTYYLKRIMSDDGLLDGSHRYNQPYNIRKLFPNAALVFGFHSSSPYSSTVYTMLKNVVKRARSSKVLRPEDADYAQNLVHSIISSDTPEPVKMRLIQAFREAWTTLTWEQNRGRLANSNYFGGRPGSSITPAYPQLDNDGVFAWPKGYKNPSFAPRCLQYRPDAKPCAVQSEN